MNKLTNLKVKSLKEFKIDEGIIPKVTKKEVRKMEVPKVVESDLYVNQHNELLNGVHYLNLLQSLDPETRVTVRKGHYTENQAFIESIHLIVANRDALTVDEKLHALLETGEYETKVKPLVELAGTTRSHVHRIKKIRSEAPDVFKKLLAGKISAYIAYNNLPSVKANVGTGAGNRIEPAGKKNLFKEQKPEDIEKAWFKANVSTLLNHMRELDSFIKRTENTKEILEELMKLDKKAMVQYKETLENLAKTIGGIEK